MKFSLHSHHEKELKRFQTQQIIYVAFCRYWSVVRYHSYKSVFKTRNLYFVAAMNWVWASLLVSPTLMGWSNLR